MEKIKIHFFAFQIDVTTFELIRHQSMTEVFFSKLPGLIDKYASVRDGMSLTTEFESAKSYELWIII